MLILLCRRSSSISADWLSTPETVAVSFKGQSDKRVCFSCNTFSCFIRYRIAVGSFGYRETDPTGQLIPGCPCFQFFCNHMYFHPSWLSLFVKENSQSRCHPDNGKGQFFPSAVSFTRKTADSSTASFQ